MNRFFARVTDFVRADREKLFDLYRAIFQRIDQQEAHIRVFESLPDRDRVLAEVETLCSRYPDPQGRPPLFCVPVGVKAVFRNTTVPIRCGSLLPSDLFTGEEADLVRSLREAGAVVLGATATSEFAHFEPAATANPLRPSHSPGGSSSGSAAGVAAGFFPLAIGTQTVGSVIRPASFCGLVGFKPTYGRYSSNGAVFVSPSVDTVGLFCTDLDEMDHVLRSLDSGWRTADVPDQAVLAVPNGPFLQQAAATTLAWFSHLLDTLSESGRVACRMVTALEDIDAIATRHMELVAAEFRSGHESWFDRYKALYRPRTASLIRDGETVSQQAAQRARYSRFQLREKLEAELDACGADVWVCPSAPGEAEKGLETTGRPVMNLPWSHAGLPCLSLPLGSGETGLPLGLQLVGRYGGDEQLFAVAARILQVASDGRQRG